MKKVHDFCINNAIFIALFAFTIVICSYVLKFHTHNFSNSGDDWGTFGDFVGGTLNPLLSFLALIILLRTFSMQREELELQREELEDTKKILKTQSQTQIKQQFESTFFALLNIHNQALEHLCHVPPPEIVDGRTRKEQSNIEKILFFIRVEMNELLPQETEQYPLLIAGKEIIRKYSPECGHYFRILYQLLKLIKTNAPTENEKMYSNIVRALLTNDVMELLAVNCYCENEQDTYWKFKLLVERYSLFEHAQFDNSYIVLALNEIKQFYDKKAFGL